MEGSGLKINFLLFNFSNVQPIRNMFLKRFVEIRKIPEVIVICSQVIALFT